MMHDPFDLTTIIFALLAVFVVWKLRSVLGQRNGNEPQRPENFPEAAPTAQRSDNVVRLPGPVSPAKAVSPNTAWQDFATPGSPLWSGLDAIRATDPRFDPAAFLDGALKAHEMILQAFAAGDVKTLKNLLGPEVFSTFAQAITGHEQRGETVETTLVSQEKSALEAAEVQGSQARVTVRFRSKMISATRDRSGVVIDGSAEQVADVQDVWTFARDLKSRDPNWKLIATLDA
jgi:predicted lipid-binding transport protein (Tim44 family)